jgi:phage baseplate assembly protein W
MAANMDHLGKDLLVTPFFEATEWDSLDLSRQPADAVFLDEPTDFASAKGVENLQQALVLRLLTPLGTLKDLGHANYGSRLHELIGQENVEAAALQARAYVLQTIAQEKRVKEILSLEILPTTPDAPDRLRIFVRVLAVGGGDPVALGLEVGL